MNKCLARILSAFIRNKNLRHKVRSILLGEGDAWLPESRDAETKSAKAHFFIAENIGGSFKRYFLEENIPEKLSRLKTNLNEDSQEFVDILIERILNFPEHKYAILSETEYAKVFDALATAGEREIVRIKNEEFHDVVKCCKFPHMDCIPDYFASFLLFCNGLYFLKEKGAEYVKNKDALDVGASFGDSALGLLMRYDPRKVYSFDISSINIDLYKKTMCINEIQSGKYEIIDKVVSENLAPISILDREDLTSLADGVPENGGRIVESIIMDQFVEQNLLQPNFIKIDVEGFELACVRGMENTIRNHRPILSISMYHNPEQFFGLKPLIESYTADLDYVFEIRPLSFEPIALVDYNLFAYPRELQ